MNKHTPGPWKIISEQTAREVQVFEVAEVAHFRVTPDRSGDTFAAAGDAYADARLIAAAPELLAALQRLFADNDVRAAAEKGAIASARASIAKATGDKE